MPQAKEPESAYPDLHHLMDVAVESPNGVEIDFSEWRDEDGQPYENPAGMAERAKWNFYTIRKRARERNAKIYGEDHPMYYRSEYDCLTIRKSGSKLRIMKSEGLLRSVTIRDPITGEVLGGGDSNEQE